MEKLIHIIGHFGFLLFVRIIKLKGTKTMKKNNEKKKYNEKKREKKQRINRKWVPIKHQDHLWSQTKPTDEHFNKKKKKILNNISHIKERKIKPKSLYENPVPTG